MFVRSAFLSRLLLLVWGLLGSLSRDLVAVLAFVSVFTALAIPAQGGGGPREVLVVINQRSPISKEIGLYYQNARGIPGDNICYISCSTSEFISKNECETRIREPIRQYLQRPELASRINYIVLTKGVPLGAFYESKGGAYSIASVLTFVGHPNVQTAMVNPYGPTAKGWWQAEPPVRWFSHDLTFTKDGVSYQLYLVTRLDAYTVDQVKQLIDRSIQPALDGEFLLDKLQSTTGYNVYANDRLGVGASSAYDVLSTTGHQAICDVTYTFVSNKSGLMGYFGWGKNDPDYTYAKFISNSFIPGAIADSYFSYSARTFIKPPDPVNPNDKTRDSLIGDLIERGVSAVGGYVSEPYITSATFPNVLFDRYTKGYNAAESFYMACPELFWKGVVIGDPLMAPFASAPQVSLTGAEGTATGVVDVEALATDQCGIAKVEFYLDGVLVGTVNQYPFVLSLDTTRYAVGDHTIEAVAYENSPVYTQASTTAVFNIQNEISVISHASQAFGYVDGQDVQLSGKTVSAGSDLIQGGFYIEETDRSMGLKILWPGTVRAGDVVDLVGPVVTRNGERCVAASQVSVLSNGSLLPKPVFIQLGSIGGGAFNALTPGVTGGTGLRNLGLRVRVAGRVKSVASGMVVLGDPNGCEVTVKPASGSQPPAGTLVLVTGVIVGEASADGLKPVIVMSRQEDFLVP